mgnify:CR=1 FL=1
MSCGCCDLNRIKKLFEEKRKREAEAAKATETTKEVVEEPEAKPIAKSRKKKAEVKEEVTEVSEEL